MKMKKGVSKLGVEPDNNELNKKKTCAYKTAIGHVVALQKQAQDIEQGRVT
jgi:hypothetical protein